MSLEITEYILKVQNIIFLEINQEESVQQRRVFLRDDGVPDLIRGRRSATGSVLGMHE